MPGYRGHILGGILTYALIFFILSFFNLTSNYTELILWLIVCISGALFPDIDIKSKGQKFFYTIFLFVLIWSIAKENWYLLSIASVIGIMPLLARHRGVSHKAWFVVAAPMIIPLSMPTCNTNTIIAYFFFVSGALSHLILDFGFVRFWRKTFGKRRSRW